MRERLIRAPWWAQALLYGVLFGGVQALFGEPAEYVVGGGVFFGLVMGPWSARFNRRYLDARGDLSTAQQG